MSLLWWQNGRDIDWFSTNLERWIKPGAIVLNSSSHNQGGRYSKLKSCRLSKTCQTMMYVPQELQGRDMSYEDQLARFQDNRTYKYSQRQEHYNNQYNYIRTSARRAYYKPETNEIILADHYDKIKTIQRQNRAKNYDYLLLLQQFLTNQQTKATEKGSKEDIGTLTSYINNNIQQYEQTDQTITLKQFLQEGIQKYEHDNLITLKDFLAESSEIAKVNKKRNNVEKEALEILDKESETMNRSNKEREMTLQEFLGEPEKNNIATLEPINPFNLSCSTLNSKINISTLSTKNEEELNMSDVNDVSFEEFLKERQNVRDRSETSFPNIEKTNHASFRHTNNKLDKKSTESHSTDGNDRISLEEFLKEKSPQLSPYNSTPADNKMMSLEEFLENKSDQAKLRSSTEHQRVTVKHKNLKLSKSFNDQTSLKKENLIKKLTRNELSNENTKRKNPTEQTENENKITLYEFLKEEEGKQSSEIENRLKNLKLRRERDPGETFYEINNNAPEIKLNDNFIQVETKTQPGIKYTQYEHNKLVCACDNQAVFTGKLYNRNCNQLLSTDYDRIDFVDRSFDYHRKVHQDDVVNSPFKYESNNGFLFSKNTQGRKCKAKNKTCISPARSIIEDGFYGPMWPSVLLTYDKVVSIDRQACLNESYA